MINYVTRFSFPTNIIFGPGAIRELSTCLSELKIKKPLLVTDSKLRSTEVYNLVENELKNCEIDFVAFDEIKPNPTDENIQDAANIFIQSRCDGLIGFGGGSSIDSAKAISVLIKNKGKLIDYNLQTGGNIRIRGPLPPVIAIPTTAGTGSEVGRCSVITSLSHGRKFLVCSPFMLPARAILDPELTIGLPSSLTAATGMDAFTHCVESLTAPVFHPMCDAIALKGIELIAQYLELAVKEPTNIKARGYMMLAAMMGAVAFQKDLGAAHSMAHPLSTECGIHHGLANAICIVPVMRFNKEVSAEEYAKVAACFGIDTFRKSKLEAAEESINAVIALNKNIGIPRFLSEVGVKEEQLPVLAKKAFEDPCHKTNPRPCSEQDLFNLFKEAFGAPKS